MRVPPEPLCTPSAMVSPGCRWSRIFVNAVAERAEAANHHPDIDIRWNTVTLRLSTHSAGGLTQADLDMASEIDGLAAAG